MHTQGTARNGLWVCAFVLSTLAAGGALAKDKPGPVRDGKVGERLEQALQEALGTDFWGSVLVAKKGDILLAAGYGMADYKAEPNTAITLHELASVSKQFAATAILHLQRKKKLSITDTLDKFFDDVPEDKRAITLHHLLTHTSGISGKIGVPYASTLPRKRYVEQMLAETLANEPGKAFEYCNVGYALLAAVVEEVTKGTFEEYLEKNMFGPAKMGDTGFITDRDLIKTKRASKRRTDEPGDWTAANWHWGWGYRGMGGVVTTVYDLHRWDRALRGTKILDEKSKEILYEPVKDGYACGWRVEKTKRGTRKVSHSGGVAGYGINVVRYLEDDVEIYVLSNDGKAAFAATEAVEAQLFR